MHTFYGSSILYLVHLVATLSLQGQFNYVEVLIQPLHEGMNLVQVLTKNGMEDKIQMAPVFISDSCLPILVRQKALQANVSLITQALSKDKLIHMI